MNDEEDVTRLVSPSVGHPGWADAVSVFQMLWRPIGCFACLFSIAIANIVDPSEPKMWVAAAAGGVGVVGRTAEKVTAMVKGP